jgi:act minimal PKS ketosynthase (KS/KS alpha)
VRRRVVVTGVGVVAPGDSGREKFWDMITAGRSATRTITLFPPEPFRSRIGAECNWDPERAGLSYREVRRTDRAGQFALGAAREAVEDAGLDMSAEDPTRVAVSVGNGVGNAIRMEQEYRVVSDSGRKWLVDADFAMPQLYGYVVSSALATEVAWAVGAEGPSTVVSTGCAAGIDGVGYGFDLVEEGSADVVVAGATDAPIYPITVACFDALRATSTSNDDPEHACRPFDLRRNGLVLGEGSAILVLEEYEHAVRRGARIYCEIVGYAARANGYHMTGLKEDGRELGEAIIAAMDQARLNPDDLDYINAHGSGTKQNDRHETAAYKRSLGDYAYQVPVSSIKSMVGHSLGAIGAIEIAACALAIDRSVVPPTANYAEPDPTCDLDCVPVTAREQPVDTVLSVGSGFGGFQSAIVLASLRDTARGADRRVAA